MIDLLFFIGILFCGLIGFKRGFTKELVSFLGFFVVVLLAFLLKNPLSQFFYQTLPFFSFGGYFKGVTALNILVYEILAFFIVLSLLLFVLRVLLFATSIFEKLLNMTIILGIPSKILGGIVGLMEGFVWTFIIFYMLTLPIFHIEAFENSKIAPSILKNTPILSSFTKDFKLALEEVNDLKEEYEITKNTQEYNYKTLEVLLKYKVISVQSASDLKEKGKLKIDNIDILLSQYKEDSHD